MKTNKGIIAIIISMIIFAGITIYGMFFLPGGDALGFGLLFIYNLSSNLPCQRIFRREASGESEILLSYYYLRSIRHCNNFSLQFRY